MATDERAAPRKASGGTETALVIGATGGVGGAAARAFAAHGWHVRALHRDPQRAEASIDMPDIEWVAGDAMSAADVRAAAKGARIILHGANPPGYRRWRELAIPMLANSIGAAKENGARLIFPGNVYNFGPDAGELVNEQSPQHPKTRKGAVRVEMEEMLAAAANDGARALVVRAGDFLAATGGSWFSAVMVKPGKPVGAVTYPGRRDVGHQWAYLPDLAETVARLAAIEAELAAFDVFHFGGHWVEPGVEIARAVGRAVGKPDIPVRSFPWILLYVAAPFQTLMRELIEMRYLWQVPLRLDNAKLVARLGSEPHTPLDEAVAKTLREMKALV